MNRQSLSHAAHDSSLCTREPWAGEHAPITSLCTREPWVGEHAPTTSFCTREPFYRRVRWCARLACLLLWKRGVTKPYLPCLPLW